MSSKSLFRALCKAPRTLRTSKVTLLALAAGAVLGQTAMAASYRVNFQRVGQNFYAVTNTPILLQTQNCYIQANNISGVLTMTSSLGIVDGRIAFDAGSTCDVSGAYGPADKRSTTSSATLTQVENQFLTDSSQGLLVRGNGGCPAASASPAIITLTTPGRAYAGGASVGMANFLGAFGQTCDLQGVYGLLDLTMAWPGPYVQVLSLAPSLIQQTKATFVASIPAVGTASWVLLDSGATAPSSSQVIAGYDANSKPAPQSGTETITDAQQAIVSLKGLWPGKAYRLCLAAKDTLGNTTQVSCQEFTASTALMDPVLRAVPAEYRSVLGQFPYFSVNYYLVRNRDLGTFYSEDRYSAQQHWLNHGIGERRDGSILFDSSWYLQKNPDLVVAFGGDTVAASIHFATAGLAEGRESSPAFNLAVYRANNPDLVRAYGNNYLSYYRHYAEKGAGECRIASNNFDPNFYLEQNQDVWKAYNGDCAAAVVHWLVYGRAEGRYAAPNQKPLPPR